MKLYLFSSIAVIGSVACLIENRSRKLNHNPKNIRKKEKKILFNDEMDSLKNSRISGINNQNAFNMRDKYFNEKFFEK